MQRAENFAPHGTHSVRRRGNIGTRLAIAWFALLAASWTSANAAPMHSHNHHYTRGGYAGPSNPLESLPTGAWTNSPRRPVEIFGQKVDP